MSDATVRLRAAIDYLRRKIDGYDSTFETAEEIAAGTIDLRGIGPVCRSRGAVRPERRPQGMRDDRACSNLSPAWFTGRWRDWHRGHGCGNDDGQPRTKDGEAEIAAGLSAGLTRGRPL